MASPRPVQQELRSLGVWGSGRRLTQAFSEQRTCMRAVYSVAERLVRSPSGTAAEFNVRLGAIPDVFFTPRKNLFSTLFYSAYLALGISQPRRMLYGKLNHLFRIWVTSADNLLDDEDKCVLPLMMPGQSRVMREVIAIMTADRVLWHILKEAVADNTVTLNQADELAEQSLRCLLPSAAQEASEEGGITKRPLPDYVLNTIHMLKTCMLFNVPFLGVDVVETAVDRKQVNRLKAALLLFGGGCQVLDDVRDVGRDFVERRHNYVLSVLAQDQPDVLKSWSAREIHPGDRIYREVLPICQPAVCLGFQKLVDACHALRSEGLLPRAAPITQMALSMLTALDLEEMAYACSQT